MHLSSLNSSANRTFDFICLWVLPLGFLLLLSSLFFLPDRSIHQKLFYGLFSIPALLAICLRPRELKHLWREPLILAYVAFAAIALLSLAWGPSEDRVSGLVKRPLHTFMLFAGTCLLLRYRNESLKPIFLSAALIALLASLLSLYAFSRSYTDGLRMVGTGAFDNPLLSSHLFGFFSTFWLFICMTSKNLRVLAVSAPAFAIMFAAVLATGSRTPLVAITLAAIWLSLICWNHRSALMISAIALITAVVVTAFPEMISSRGDSFRFEIWTITLQLINEKLLLGHGYGSHLSIDPGTGYSLSEPHSFALGVLYYVGIIGFLPWLAMQAWGLLSCWRHRTQPLFILASSLLVFGIGAGLTEGGGILSRPKEHWFLLWIPLALIAALNISRRTHHLLGMRIQPLSPPAAGTLMTGADVIEEDGLGPKVLRLGDGSFLKLFRGRRWYTSGSFHPYSERFASNSQLLSSLGFSAPPILDLYRLSDGSTAVRYQPLPGRTLRQVFEATQDSAERQVLAQKFGRYLAHLHEQGIYFRSLHLGNVLLLDNGELGLIDVADMRILPSSLSLALRRRNLRHMQRYTQDRGWLFEENLAQLLKGYAALASDKAVKHMHKHAHLLKHTAG
ncbi:bifunctional O-antigen ligase/aminoglycoside phosphotransferase family protein [Pseudomonas sp. LS1212]|uniref:bifunctional O-antigen ligase/aminoglycoside phosphotransferase family protein n=1 Tax=Pseudomonas sp. LS1212 TaxID=2972478 RepID=UPI00215CD1A2|nr:bifunctional O-antigen ligase/aminoglycoside phosphotransferase family protein [Pseudomonas sp. LS1212]UVJ44446.1 bifunctional O-antigen ligase/aminoglycoside phosphotransferase family protein [Pseudomonas sp. LS1212]